MAKSEERNYKAIAEAYEQKELQTNEAQRLRAKTRIDNWLDLVNHFQAKVNKRTSEVAFLQTKAGFLIAAAVIALQMISDLDKYQNPIALGVLILSVLAALTSLVIAIISMSMKATSPLNPEKMVTDLSSEKHANMDREAFAKWLADSYKKTNTRFNKEYSRKYKQQLAAAILLVSSFVLTLILKGFGQYVGL